MIDFGKLSDPHLQLLLQNILHDHGLPALIYPVNTFDNALVDTYPESVVADESTGSCKVALSKPVEGLRLSDFISLTDKLETEYKVITNAELEINQHLVVTYPSSPSAPNDEKTLTLRITETHVYHALSTVYWFYKAIVV